MPLMQRFAKSASPKPIALAAALCALAACDKAEGPAATSKLLTLTAPKAGSAWKVGDSLAVAWARHDDASGRGRQVSAIEVFLSPDGGQNWGALTGTRAIQPGSMQWTSNSFKWRITDSLYIPDLNQTLPLTNTPQGCRVLIKDYTLNDDDDLADTSGNITINPGP